MIKPKFLRLLKPIVITKELITHKKRTYRELRYGKRVISVFCLFICVKKKN